MPTYALFKSITNLQGSQTHCSEGVNELSLRVLQIYKVLKLITSYKIYRCKFKSITNLQGSQTLG